MRSFSLYDDISLDILNSLPSSVSLYPASSNMSFIYCACLNNTPLLYENSDVDNLDGIFDKSISFSLLSFLNINGIVRSDDVPVISLSASFKP